MAHLMPQQWSLSGFLKLVRVACDSPLVACHLLLRYGREVTRSVWEAMLRLLRSYFLERWCAKHLQNYGPETSTIDHFDRWLLLFLNYTSSMISTFSASIFPSHCWWKKSGEPPIIHETLWNVGDSLYQLVQDFFHQQYHGQCGNFWGDNQTAEEGWRWLKCHFGCCGWEQLGPTCVFLVRGVHANISELF